jgi:hypothetical protein
MRKNPASCEAPHFQYHASGKLAIRMDDGTEFVAGPGDITSLPKGHDAWLVGNESVVVVDWFGASNYAKRTQGGPLRAEPNRPDKGIPIADMQTEMSVARRVSDARRAFELMISLQLSKQDFVLLEAKGGSHGKEICRLQGNAV